jgi:non-heme chloroperoxidase
MVAALPDCPLIMAPGIGHSMNLESPALYAGYFGAWFGSLSERDVAI